jgi:hypothetical protein
LGQRLHHWKPEAFSMFDDDDDVQLGSNQFFKLSDAV